MKPGERFELESLAFLKSRYEKNGISFIHRNTSDSTGSDIEVLKDGRPAFFIEAKDTEAQSGQFVLLPDDKARKFIFSPRNKSIPNEMTRIMIEYMNADFDRFNKAGTAGEALVIDPEIFTNWIIGHYKEKKVRYVISRGKQMFILPIEKFGEYFEVSANFRIKKSGSREPAEKNIDTLINTLQQMHGITDIRKETVNGKKKLFVNAPAHLSKTRFELDGSTYYLSPQETDGIFEVKQLSKTNNKNVIFRINVKQEQAVSDLASFEAELGV